MLHSSPSIPCAGFNVAVLFPDVEPEVLAHEAANEAKRAGLNAGLPWQSSIKPMLPAGESNSAQEMARSLVKASVNEPAAISYANAMRRSAIAGGDVRRARFWAGVAGTIASGTIEN